MEAKTNLAELFIGINPLRQRTDGSSRTLVTLFCQTFESTANRFCIDLSHLHVWFTLSSELRYLLCSRNDLNWGLSGE